MDLNHVAVFVDSLDKTTLAAALGGWGGPVVTITDQPVTVDGRPGGHSGRTRRVRTASEPPFGVSIEDVTPDAPIQPEPGNAWHHVAIWCDDVRATVEALEANGYRKDVVGRDPDGQLATFAYMVADSGPRVEVADAAMRERMHAYHARTAADKGIEVASSGLSAPLTPIEVAVVVSSVADLERLRSCWQAAFGADWGKVIESTTQVDANGETRALRVRSVSTRTLPCVTILAPLGDSRALLAPVAGDGWHHVAFRSGNLDQDMTALRQKGFVLEFCDHVGDKGQHCFAMLVAPEGTRVKLTG